VDRTRASLLTASVQSLKASARTSRAHTIAQRQRSEVGDRAYKPVLRKGVVGLREIGADEMVADEARTRVAGEGEIG
jgi:hypothetical protein